MPVFMAEFRVPRSGKVDADQEAQMNEDRMAQARADAQQRVSKFQETQVRFQRERDDYYESAIERVRAIRWNRFVVPRPQPTN
ncbi:MAG: hypothetical protein ABWY18_19275 [Tardiphaga sp.]